MVNSMVKNSPLRDFDDLVQELPYWAREAYGPTREAIDRVRSALEEYESNQVEEREILTDSKSVVV